MFMFFCIYLYCRMYSCTNKGKNVIKIAVRLMIPILQPAMSTNFTQNWREHCSHRMLIGNQVVLEGE